MTSTKNSIVGCKWLLALTLFKSIIKFRAQFLGVSFVFNVSVWFFIFRCLWQDYEIKKNLFFLIWITPTIFPSNIFLRVFFIQLNIFFGWAQKIKQNVCDQLISVGLDNFVKIDMVNATKYFFFLETFCNEEMNWAQNGAHLLQTPNLVHKKSIEFVITYSGIHSPFFKRTINCKKLYFQIE